MVLRKKSYKDMAKFKETRREQRLRYYRKYQGNYPSRRWTDAEDKLVLAHKMTDPELSVQIKRSVAAIQHRRVILKNGK
jgi:hypothetical protein